MDARYIERIVRHAGYMLAESLWDYWPTVGNNDISERNISLYLSISFHEKGFKCFAEGHWKNSTDKRIDFFAIDPNSRMAICAECKRLYSAEKCNEMVEDYYRIKSFMPLDLGGKSFPKYGILAATTMRQEIVDWWASLGSNNKPSEDKSWDNLYKSLKNGYWGCVPLNSYDEETSLSVNQKEKHYLLYIIFEI